MILDKWESDFGKDEINNMSWRIDEPYNYLALASYVSCREFIDRIFMFIVVRYK